MYIGRGVVIHGYWMTESAKGEEGGYIYEDRTVLL